MAKKTQAERLEEAAKFVGDAADEMLGEQDDDVLVDDEFEINDPDEEATDEADDADVTPEPEVDSDEVPATPEAAETMALIERALDTDEVDDWNKVAAQIYRLEQIKYKTPGMKASRLAPILERLP